MRKNATRITRCLICLLSVLLLPQLRAAEAPGHADKTPDVKAADKAEKEKGSGDPELEWVKTLKLPLDIRAVLWTSPKQVINPVAICFDEMNRAYVTEEHRFRVAGGLDIREHKYMYYDDLCGKTLDDRRALYKKYKDKFEPDYFTKNKEKIVRLEDSTHSGRADKLTVYAEGFNDELDGPGLGIAYLDGKIYYTCVPKIWKLEDTKGDGVADKKEVMFDGFGIRVSISGHDVHGAIIGPDGRLYWSMGDRGYNITTPDGKNYTNPVGGGVFRCNLDGSGFEVYYNGLRNPEELAFDEYGNLFTVDNNADIGDGARVTYILEGGNTGWSHGFQLLGNADFAKEAGLGGKRPNPWMQEELWKTRHPGQPAWILPPVGLITNGPCGLTYDPGVTGMPDEYAHLFYVCDYTSGSNSGVHTFSLKEDGAGYVMKDPKKFIWGITATDVAFGYDGKLYVVDYGGGWALPGKGRIITAFNDKALAKPAVAELQKIFADGFKTRGIKELTDLLQHADARVRQSAQFELAKRGKEGLEALSATANAPGNSLARLHGIWGMSQIAREQAQPDVLKTLAVLLTDSDVHVRETATKMLSDAVYAPAAEKYIALLKDPSERIRALAAIALGKIKYHDALGALVEVLRDNDDKDAFLRHGAIMGLAGIGDAEALEKYATDSSKAVRLGVLLTYRRLKEPRAALFLKDADPFIYDEAIRVIYDVPIVAAMPQLAAELKRNLEPVHAEMTPLIYARLIQANFRYGSVENAGVLAEFAAKAKAPEEIRILALELLKAWAEPGTVDPVVGLFRPVPKRPKLEKNPAINAALSEIINGNSQEVSARAVEMALEFGIEMKDETLLKFLKDSQKGESLRVNSLAQLLARKNTELLPLIPDLLNDESLKLRIAALDAYLKLDPAAGIAAARGILSGSKQNSSEIKITIDKTLRDWNTLKIGKPSNLDYADQHSGNKVTFTYVKGFAKPHAKAGADGIKLPRLNDGAASETSDDLERSVWFEGTDYRILADLQKPIEVCAVNSYSWHVSDRAPQSFILWGASGDTPPDAAAKDLSRAWTKIATVDTSSLKDGGMHGSSVNAANGVIGKFQYLLWQNKKAGNATFFTEFDVYEKGQWSLDEITLRVLKQQALLSLGKTSDPRAAEVITEWLDKMEAGQAPLSLHLELIEAAQMRTEENVIGKLKKYQEALSKTDKLAPFRIALQGGDAKCGEEIFQFHAAACIRCHKVNEAGGDAGPKLAGVGVRLSREKLLESLIDPSAVVVPGYGVTTFKMNDGTIIIGAVLDENPKQLVVKLQPDGKQITLQATDIKKRTAPISPMPPMDTLLKPREIRDVIEFLSKQTSTPAAAPDGDTKH